MSDFKVPPPPEGYTSWTQCYESNGIPEENWPISVAMNIMAERRLACPEVLAPSPPHSPIADEKKKKKREHDPDVSAAPPNPWEIAADRDLRAALPTYALKQKARAIPTWVSDFEDRYNDGYPIFFLSSLVTEKACTIWRFEGCCPVCREIHDCPLNTGRCWSVAWDHKSLNCVCTCLKTGKRRFVRALSGM